MRTHTRRHSLPLALAVLALGLATATGCASVVPVSPRRIDPGAPSRLEPEEGILVVDVDTELPIGSIRFGRITAAGDLPPGEHFYLLAVPAGDYAWSQIAIPHVSGDPARFYFHRHDVVQFSVEAGRINYPGRLVVRGQRRDRYVRLGGRIANRSAKAAAELAERYPHLLVKYPPRYAGSYRDDFLNHYSTLAERGMVRSKGASTP